MKSTKTVLAVAILIAVVPSCSMPASEPAPSTPLPQGVFRATQDCDIRTTSPSGVQTTQTNTLSVAFEINGRGVLIGDDGEEIAVGQTVEFVEGLELTYTRIEATTNGVIIRSTISGSVNPGFPRWIDRSGMIRACSPCDSSVSGHFDRGIQWVTVENKHFAFNSTASSNWNSTARRSRVTVASVSGRES